MNVARKDDRGIVRGALSAALVGLLLSVSSLLTYFFLVPRWPDLRDSGALNVALAGVGVILGFVGLLRARKARRWRRTSLVALCAAGCAFAFLTFYIYDLSYRLPSPDEAIPAGAEAPAFSLLDQDGRERSLAEFRGNPLFLIFFRGHW